MTKPYTEDTHSSLPTWTVLVHRQAHLSNGVGLRQSSVHLIHQRFKLLLLRVPSTRGRRQPPKPAAEDLPLKTQEGADARGVGIGRLGKHGVVVWESVLQGLQEEGDERERTDRMSDACKGSRYDHQDATRGRCLRLWGIQNGTVVLECVQEVHQSCIHICKYVLWCVRFQVRLFVRS